MNSLRETPAVVAAAVLAATSALAAQEPPDSSSRSFVSANLRIRYERLWNQFRPVLRGENEALALRTRLVAALRFSPVEVGVELSDSRVLLAHDPTRENSAFVNPLDLLQAYVSATFTNPFAEGDVLRARLGRQTMDLGSRRLVARNRFRNTSNAFTGLNVEWVTPDRRDVRVFVTVPVQRRINPPEGNEIRLDLERMESVFWGLSLGTRLFGDNLRAELNLLGIHERDSEGFLTTNRNFVSPGMRILRSPRPNMFDLDIEGVVQAGTSRSTLLPEDTTDLDHLAFFAHASVGYTLAATWGPRLVLQYDYASGDADPADDRNGRFDTLFGARRFEFGPTGIYGAFARSNIHSPGARLEVTPHEKVAALVAYRPAWLAQARDRWVTTLLWDEAGESGTFLGHQVEARLRWQAAPRYATLETGFAYLRLGNFPKAAPDGPLDAGNPVYVYLQLTLQI